MSFRFRKSKSIAPGVRLNLSKTGVGVSVGGKGVRKSYHSSGRSTSTVGVPGTGVHYRKDSRSGSVKPRSGSSRQHVAQPPTPPAKPGLFAPRGEKLLYKAIKNNDVAAMEQVARDFDEFRWVANALAGVNHYQAGNRERAKTLLDGIARSGRDPAAETFWQRYLNTGITLTFDPGIDLRLPVDGTVLALLASELHADSDDLEAALRALDRWPQNPLVRLAQADYHTRRGDHDAVIAVTEGVTNDDDVTVTLLTHRGAAFREQGHYTAAREALKEALRARRRTPAVRHAALHERALTNLADGKKAQARKDADKIIAENSTHQGAHDVLAVLTSN